jgi:very-short-patch-repair endonuclease
MTSGGMRFLRTNDNLFNVAITRARVLLIVVGDIQACIDSRIEYLKEFAVYTQELNKKHTDNTTIQIGDLGPEYPPVHDMSIVSDWEITLYKEMYKQGIRAIPQYSVDKYVLDFALFEGNRMLNIEVDGEYYHKDWNGELCRKDQIRNRRMIELGWDVMRFWVYEVRDDLCSVIRRIQRWQNHEL